MTFECWFKAESLPSSYNYSLFSTFDSDSRGGYILGIREESGTPKIIWTWTRASGSSGLKQSKINYTFNIGQWYHLAMTFIDTSAIVEYFINGISIGTGTIFGSATGALDVGTSDFYIGGSTFATYFDGLIDDARVWNDVRTSGEIRSNYNTELIGNEAGLVGYYKFNNDANDSTSNGNDLTETNSPTYSTDVAFLSDNANTHSIDLEASSNQYLIRTDTNLSSNFPGKSTTGHTGDTTWEGWFNFEGTGAVRLFVKYATSQKCFYSVYSTNLMYFGISPNKINDYDKTWSWTPTPGTWYHLAFVYNGIGGQVEFFVNGLSQGTNTGYNTTLQQTTADFEIGDFTFRNAYFDGKIDDFRVWTIARTSTEIANNFNKELTGTEPNLQGYWKLNNSPNDLTSNANHLTETNSPVYSTDTPF